MRNPEWLNTVSIISESGKSRELNLFSGDMFSASADLFVVSTHHNGTFPVAGKVWEEVQSRFSVESDLQEWVPSLSHKGVSVFFPGFLDEKKRWQWVLLRIPSLAFSDLPEDFEGFQSVISILFSALAAQEHLGASFRKISMPVIAGQRLMERGLDMYQRAIRILIEEASRWLKESRYSECVNLFVFEKGEVPYWNQAMNEVLGREIIDSKNHELIEILQNQVLDGLDRVATRLESETFFHGTIKPLRKEIQSENPYLGTIVEFSRRVLECFVNDLANRQGIRIDNCLSNDIKKLKKEMKLAPWFSGYLDIIRIAGNNSVHYPKDGYIPEKLKNGDLIAVYSALTNMLDFWIDQIDSPE
ncbi:MAG TPA: hypothetical protein P5560_13460 [Thermotogota bacterium]|nr:hypothetical protein [Thermotogota bacterium]